MAVTLLAGLALILTLKYAQALVIPIVLGILINYALAPLVVRLVRCHLPRALAAALVLCGVLGTGGALLYQLRDQADTVVRQLPEAALRFRRMLEREKPAATTALEQVQKAATELERAADAATAPSPPRAGIARVQVETRPVNIGEYVRWGWLGLAAGAGQFLLVVFLAFFLLASGDLYRRKLVKIAGPSLTQKRITVQILEQIDRQIESFLFVQIITSTVVGIASWAVFRWLGLEQAGLWGLFAGVFNSIPYFGPVVVTGGTAVIALLQFGSLRMVLLVAGAALTITTLEGFLLTPWLTSRAARMNAVAMFVGLIFWGWVWDVWGLLLAVPMMVVMKAICDHIDDFKNVGELLGE